MIRESPAVLYGKAHSSWMRRAGMFRLTSCRWLTVVPHRQGELRIVRSADVASETLIFGKDFIEEAANFTQLKDMPHFLC